MPNNPYSTFPGIYVGSNDVLGGGLIGFAALSGTPANNAAEWGNANSGFEFGFRMVSKQNGALYENLGSAAIPNWFICDCGGGGIGAPMQWAVEAGAVAPTGNTYATWDLLYPELLAFQIQNPDAQNVITFDNQLTPGVAVPITQPAGIVGALQLNNVTFKGAGGPLFQNINGTYAEAVPVEIAPDVTFALGSSVGGAGTAQKTLVLDSINLRMLVGRTAGAITDAVSTEEYRITLRAAQWSNADLAEAFLDLTDSSLFVSVANSNLANPLVAIEGTFFNINVGAGDTPFTLDVAGASIVGANLFGGLGTTVLNTTVDPEAQLGEQIALLSGVGIRSFLSLTSNAALRSGPTLTVFTLGQLVLDGASEPIIKQAYALNITVLPTAADTLTFIRTGLANGVLTWVPGAPAAFEVQIAGTPLACELNLIAAINTNFAADRIATQCANPQTGGNAVCIVPTTQDARYFDERVIGTQAVVSIGAVSFPSAASIVPLNYSNKIARPIPAADDGFALSGFANAQPVADGTNVLVLDGLTGGSFVAQRVQGGGAGRWQYLSNPSEPVSVVGAGAITLNRDEKIIDVTLAAVEVATLALSTFTQVGQSVTVTRLDTAGGATLTMGPPGDGGDLIVNGISVAGYSVPENSTVTFTRLENVGGLAQWTVSSEVIGYSNLEVTLVGVTAVPQTALVTTVILAAGIVASTALRADAQKGVIHTIARLDADAASSFTCSGAAIAGFLGFLDPQIGVALQATIPLNEVGNVAGNSAVSFIIVPATAAIGVGFVGQIVSTTLAT